MKSLKNYVILSLGLIIALLVIMANGVQATSPTLIFGNNTTTNTATTNSSAVGAPTTGINGVTTNTTTTNSTLTTNVTPTNVTPTKDPATVNVTNTAKNNTTTNTTKEKGNLPQTGENDIYIVTGIGVVALIIGGLAYMKSRKYDM